MQHHENTPRLSLLPAIHDALVYDEPDTIDVANDGTTLAELREQTFYADAAPVDPTDQNEDADGDRTFDELF
ncbi:hypothetical protein [Haladaptatus sp. NG-SE-30]